MHDDRENFICWDLDGEICDTALCRDGKAAAQWFMELHGESYCMVAPFDGSWTQKYKLAAVRVETEYVAGE